MLCILSIPLCYLDFCFVVVLQINNFDLCTTYISCLITMIGIETSDLGCQSNLLHSTSGEI